MLQQIENDRGFSRSLRMAFRHRLQVAQAGVLLSTGFQVPLRKFDVPLATMKQCYLVAGNSLNKISHLRPQMEPYEVLAGRRLEIGLALVANFRDNQVNDRQKFLAEIPELLQVWERLKERTFEADELRKTAAGLEIVYEQMLSGGQDVELRPDQTNNWKAMLSQMRQETMTIRYSMEQVKYPFDHAQGKIGIGSFLLGDPFGPGFAFRRLRGCRIDVPGDRSLACVVSGVCAGSPNMPRTHWGCCRWKNRL